MVILPETPEHIAAIRHVTDQAFGRSGEGQLIDALRANDKVILSLVATQDDEVVGHVLFFPVVIESEGITHSAVGLGPMAVLPQHQGQGAGSALVRQGLELLRNQHYGGVIVLGHPEFYPRFGFVPASTFGISTSYEVPDEVFMAAELQPGGLSGKGGLVVYSEEFNEV